MGYRYRQLTLEERCTITRLYGEGASFRQIAKALDREPSTITREVKRNITQTRGYDPAYAQAQAQTQARRWKGSRLVRQPDLRDAVLERLAMGYSPEQVAGRLAREQGKPVISHESIYRFIAAQIRRTKDGSWRHYLPQAKARRGYRARKGRGPDRYLPGRVSIHARPNDVQTRSQPGHWEADLMSFAKGTTAMVIAQERTSRLLMMAPQPNKSAALVASCLRDMLAPVPPVLRQTLTLDNGAEFAKHQTLPLPTFFCDPHSPWQKGSVENAIGRLRRYLPRKTDPTTLNQHDIIAIVRNYNHTPRKCLDFQTPAEVFLHQLLHFKCESTPVINTG
jgi:transposase, IS30 family